jgi:hypothetical protein
MPADADEAGCSVGGSKFVASIDVTDGVIEVTASAEEAKIEGDTYVLTPGPNTTSDVIDWNCTASTIDNKFLPANCRGS